MHNHIMKFLKATVLVLLPIIVLAMFFVNGARPGRLIFSIFMIAFIFERVWESLYTSKEKESEVTSTDWTLPLSIMSYIVLVILSIVEFYAIVRNLSLFVTGVATMVYAGALLLRLWAVFSLGTQWSVHIIGESKLCFNRTLITKGPYGYVRHPVYLGIVLEQVSLPLIFNLYYTAFFMLLISCSLQCIKTYLEEKEMQRKFGNAYVSYAAETPRYNLVKGLLKKVR